MPRPVFPEVQMRLEAEKQGGGVEGAKESFYWGLLEHTCVLPRVIQQRERLVRKKRACHNEER